MVMIGANIDDARIDGDLNRLHRYLENYDNMGLQCVEIPPHGMDVIKNGSIDEKRLAAVKDLLDIFDFKYSVHAPEPLNLMDRDNPALHLEVFRASLDFAEEIGADTLVYHAGRFYAEVDFPPLYKPSMSEDHKNKLLDLEAYALQRLADDYEDTYICIENPHPYLIRSPYCYAERIDLLKEQVLKVNRENVMVSLDIGRMHMASKFYGFNSVEAAKNIRDMIGHVHVHDNFGESVYHYEKRQTRQIPFGRGDSHMPIGMGSAPIREVLSTFIEQYNGALILELKDRYYDELNESIGVLDGIVSTLLYGECEKGSPSTI